MRDHEVISYITVVIDPRGAPFGTLAAVSRKQRTFSHNDVSFMQSVANVLATGSPDAGDRLRDGARGPGRGGRLPGAPGHPAIADRRRGADERAPAFLGAHHQTPPPSFAREACRTDLR